MQQGIAGLRLSYQGAQPYMDQPQAVLKWLRQKNYWPLPELQQHLELSYGVVF